MHNLKRQNKYWAHSLEGKSIRHWHSLGNHLKGTADLAELFASEFEAGSWGRTAGFLHDLGKTSKEFQGYLRHVNDVNDEISDFYKQSGLSKVDHSTAGCQYAEELFGQQAGRILSYCVAGHHGGLPDGLSVDSCLKSRLQKSDIPVFDLKYSKRLKLSIDTNEIGFPKKDQGFFLSFFIRMIFSCLVDADFLDTESFMSPEKTVDRKKHLSISDLWEKLNTYTSQFDPTSSTINKKRCEILNTCIEKAKNKAGFFSLTVPTGGGKTISSLAFALKHALAHGKQRVIYVIPYTSIIEQNAEVFRNILGEEAVLEHHSNFDPDKETRFSKLASQNWDAPIVVTTNVQFFESLFANKTSRCRKLHNIANAVVILDEAQMLPVHLLKPCLKAMDHLVSRYKTSIVLCTATQPALNKTDNFKDGLSEVQEIIDDVPSLFKAFKRVSIESINEDINSHDLVVRLDSHDQFLCIVNTKKHAREIYELLKSKTNSIESLFHLSANMCPEHRTEKLIEIREALCSGKKCKVISTQLIEAGVDVDFPVVFRSMAGIDSIAQSAGRCNREGKRKSGKVIVFKSTEHRGVGHIRQCAEVGEQILRRYEDPLSTDSVNDYFSLLYWQNADLLDSKSIIRGFERGMSGSLWFPFRKTAEDFAMIESNTKSIIVPYSENGRNICDIIMKKDLLSPEMRFVDTKTSRKAGRLSVQVHPNVFNELQKWGAITSFHDEQYWILTNERLYDKEMGLLPDDPATYDIESTIL